MTARVAMEATPMDAAASVHAPGRPRARRAEVITAKSNMAASVSAT